eukprot:6188809-Pleurochrysis_carterae.AAC.1
MTQHKIQAHSHLRCERPSVEGSDAAIRDASAARSTTRRRWWRLRRAPLHAGSSRPPVGQPLPHPLDMEWQKSCKSM